MYQSTSQAIPTISLRSLTLQTHDPAERAQHLTSLRHALLNIGFLYLADHSISKTTIQNLLEILPELFSLPEEVKDSVALINAPGFLGYSSFGEETTAGNEDQREQFEFTNEVKLTHTDGKDVPLHLRLLGRNQWPEVKLSNTRLTVKEIVATYIAALQDLADRFLDLIEEALELDKGTLKTFTGSGAQDRLKLVHYHSGPQPPSLPSDATNTSRNADFPGKYIQGVGPHKDSSGWLTFLFQTQPPGIHANGKGLQVLTKAGDWIDVAPLPDTFVVNMGQAFEVVTSGLCKATTHRVLLPDLSASCGGGGGGGGYDRYSVPFFQGVKPHLTKSDFMALWDIFDAKRARWIEEDAQGEADEQGQLSQGRNLLGNESDEAQKVDSPFLRGKYNTWGEAQLRTKIRSHRDVGKKWYADVYERYVNDDA